MTDQSNEIFKAYSVLGLPVNASQDDIKEKFKELARQVCSLVHLASARVKKVKLGELSIYTSNLLLLVLIESYT